MTNSMSSSSWKRRNPRESPDAHMLPQKSPLDGSMRLGVGSRLYAIKDFADVEDGTGVGKHEPKDYGATTSSIINDNADDKQWRWR